MEKKYLQLMEEIRRWQKGDGDDKRWYSLILVVIILENPTRSKHFEKKKRVQCMDLWKVWVQQKVLHSC